MQAFIFDFDGVIVDTEKHWPTITRGHIKKFIPEISTEMETRVVGADWLQIYNWLQEDYDFTATKEEFFAIDRELILDIYSQANLNPGFTEFMEQIQEHFTKVGLGTGSSDWFLHPTLEKLQLTNYFNAIVCSSDVAEGRAKPAPDIYLQVAEQLQVEPKECIVIEDSKNGIAAAKAAGMSVIAIDHKLGTHTQDTSAADMHVQGFAEIDVAAIKALTV